MSDSFYREFEDRHRGSRELIKSRLAVYLPFLTPFLSQGRRVNALDLGCGRGEWLELLTEHGLDAYGIDMDSGMLAACYERGLRVDLKDALSALRESASGSVDVISAFHVVEHIPFDDLRSLAREAMRVLRPGGLLILETPNPENLSVGSSSFYMDPSHERPIPSQLLDFVVEHSGFQRTKVLRLQEAAELHHSPEIELLQVLKGVSPDYSVIGQKSAAPDVLAAFDPLFETEYGLSLDLLAQRYDSQHQARLHMLKESVEQRIAAEIGHVNSRLMQAETAAKQAETRFDQTCHDLAAITNRLAAYEARLVHTEAQAASYAAQINALLNSRSWKITAPLRSLAGNAYRIRSAAKEGRIKSGIKRRLRTRLRTLVHAILKRPQLAQPAFRMLNLMPGLKQKLRRAILDTPSPTVSSQIIERHSDLSPRAEYVYARLKKHIDARKS